MVLDIGELISAMIECNINIWKQASQIKTFDGVPRQIDPVKRIFIGEQIRQLNAKRSYLRWEIDKILMEDPLNDCKIDYMENE